jgi:hypothetical protein
MNKILFLFTFCSLIQAFEEQKATIISKLYTIHRHQLIPANKHKKFMGNYLNDAYKILKCVHFSAHHSSPEAQQYFDALTDYIIENCMYEMVLRKSHRFFRLRNNKLADATINLRSAIESIHRTGLVQFDIEQEFTKTRDWFNRANAEYFKKIGLKK